MKRPKLHRDVTVSSQSLQCSGVLLAYAAACLVLLLPRTLSGAERHGRTVPHPAFTRRHERLLGGEEQKQEGSKRGVIELCRVSTA